MTKNQQYSMKGSTILENGEEITAWDCCDLLNELHSTVIYQRQNIDKLTQKNSELEYENNELKTKIKKLKIENDSQSDAIEGLQGFIAHFDLEEILND